MTTDRVRRHPPKDKTTKPFASVNWKAKEPLRDWNL
jgi:hypothetical protein